MQAGEYNEYSDPARVLARVKLRSTAKLDKEERKKERGGGKERETRVLPLLAHD